MRAATGLFQWTTVALLGATVLISGCGSLTPAKTTPLGSTTPSRSPSSGTRISGGSTATAPTRQTASPTPAKSKATASAPTSRTSTTTARPATKSGGLVHVVQPGETLFRIANAYGVSLKAITDANPQMVPDRLEVGENLNIPVR